MLNFRSKTPDLSFFAEFCALAPLVGTRLQY